MSFNSFLKEHKKGMSSRAYFLHGIEPFFIKEAERIIKSSISDEKRDFGLNIYDLDQASGSKVSLKEVLDSLNTFSFFSESKIVIIQNLQKLKKADLEPLEQYLADPSDSSTLFMFYNGKPKASFRAISSSSMKISLDLSPGELRTWIVSYASGIGIKLSTQATEYLLEILNSDAGLISSELTKLSLLGKDTIDLKDIGDLIYGEAGIDTFDLTRAIASGNKKKAFSLAGEISGADPNMLMGAINWQIAKLKGKRPNRTLIDHFKALLDADTVNKSTGTYYPTELLITKLLGR